jgi:hypothetical protein
MGLFDKIVGDKKSSDKNIENEEEKPQFKSIIVESENIPREIKSVATTNQLKMDALDFKIIKVKTLFSDGKEEGWIEADSEKLKLFDSEDFLLNPDLKIKQSFKVEIYKKDDHEDDQLLPEITLSGNKFLTRIIANIKKNLEIKYFSKLEQNIIEEINKKKIKAGIFVGVHDANLYKEVKKIVAGIRVNNVLDSNHSFIVCQCVDPIAPINDDLIYHYKKKVVKEDEHGRVDYSKRGYILAVDENECIIEYIKAKKGKPGRNCQGKFLAVSEPKTTFEVAITISENIAKKEDDDKIKYISKRSGYVKEPSPNNFDIDDQMEIDEISFKSTGSIETSMSSNVKINIKEADIFKDAIGPGMSVETSELNVEGNVGSGAKIKVNKLDIGGQTHKTSTINAKEAHIMTHRGEIIGEVISVDRLEGGKIIGDKVSVKQVIGGEIIAKEVVIDELVSNATIIASDKIEIKELKGNNNKFLIDPAVTKEFNEEIAKINKQIKDLKIKLKPIPTQLDDKKRLIDKTKPTVQMVKEKIEELKNDGKTPPITLINKIKEFQNMVNTYNDMLKKYKDDKAQLEDLHSDLNEVQLKVFSAKIINHSPWLEFNEIKFKLISPAVEVTYNTKDHEIIREMTLKQVGDSEYKINRSSEYSS